MFYGWHFSEPNIWKAIDFLAFNLRPTSQIGAILRYNMIEKGQRTWIVAGISVLSVNKTLNQVIFSGHFSILKNLNQRTWLLLLAKQ